MESELFYKQLVEKSRELICYHEANGTYLYVSPSIKAIAGYEAEELIGKNPYDYFHPDDIEKIHSESHQPALEGDNTVKMEYRFRKKDGSYIWFCTLTQPIFDVNGTVIHLHTTTRDITAEKVLREDLKKHKNIWHEASKLAKTGAWEYNLETEVFTLSDEIYQIHEILRIEELNMDKVFSSYPKSSKQLFIKSLEKTIKTGKSFDIKIPHTNSKGNKLWVRIIGKAERIHKKTTKVYGVLRDITKDIENEKKLQSMVDYLTDQNQQLEDFNQIVSHNLRSPVSNLSVLLDIYENTNSQKEKDEYFKILKNLSQNILETLDELVDIVKIKQNHEIRKEKLHFKKMVEKAISHLKAQVIELDAEINTDFTELDNIVYPKIYMESIFLNLMSNALKYSSPERKPERK